MMMIHKLKLRRGFWTVNKMRLLIRLFGKGLDAPQIARHLKTCLANLEMERPVYKLLGAYSGLRAVCSDLRFSPHLRIDCMEALSTLRFEI